jgi:hypothetical protein
LNHHEVTLLKESLNRSDDEPDEWKHANQIMGAMAWVTAEEARQAAAEVEKVLDTYARRAREDSPEGTRQVRLFAAVTLAALPPRSGG